MIFMYKTLLIFFLFYLCIYRIVDFWCEAFLLHDTGELCHKRLCHMSVKGMKRLVDDNLIPVKDVHLERCTDWLTGKQNRTSFRLAD